MTNDLTVRGEPNLPGLLPDDEDRRLLAQFTTFDEGRDVAVNRKPTMVEREMLARRGKSLELLLRPVSSSPEVFTVPNERGGTDRIDARQFAKQRLGLFFSNYPSLRSGDPRPMIAAYLHTLREVPVFALERALDDIAGDLVTVSDGRGGQKPLDRNFPPPAPQILSVARGFTNDLHIEATKIVRVLRATIVEQPAPTEAQRKAIVPKIRRMAEQAKAVLNRIDPDEAAAREEAERVGAEMLEKSNRHFSAAAIEEYGIIGMEPVVAGDMVVSPELVLSNRAKGAPPEYREPVPERRGTSGDGTTRSTRGGASKARSKQKGDR